MDQSVQLIIQDLYKSDFSEHNADLNIDIVGYLNYTQGVKLRLTYVDSFEDDDVHEWREIARKHGAFNLKLRVNTSEGNIDLNIEYKRFAKNISSTWMLRVLFFLIAVSSYHYLHQLNPVRYPLPEMLSV